MASTKPTEIPPIEAEAAITPPTTNGASSGPRIVRREKWLSLPPGDYEGFEFLAWINYPMNLINTIKNEPGEEQSSALGRIVLKHNGWRNIDGTPFPPTTDPAFWDMIPDEVMNAMFAAIDVEKSKLPNLVRTMKRQ